MKENKSKLIIVAMIYILWLLFFYVAIAFVVWEINPQYWEDGTRFLMVFFGGLIGLFIAYIISTLMSGK